MNDHEIKCSLNCTRPNEGSMVNFCYAYEHILENYGLYATGTTGGRIEAGTNLKVNKLASGPLGGDQQIGSLIVTEAIDLVIF